MADSPSQSLVFVNATTGRIDHCARQPNEADLIGVARAIVDYGPTGQALPIGSDGWHVALEGSDQVGTCFTMLFGLDVPTTSCVLWRNGILGEDDNPWLIVRIQPMAIRRVPVQRYIELVPLERAVAFALLEAPPS